MAHQRNSEDDFDSFQDCLNEDNSLSKERHNTFYESPAEDFPEDNNVSKERHNTFYYSPAEDDPEENDSDTSEASETSSPVSSLIPKIRYSPTSYINPSVVDERYGQFGDENPIHQFGGSSMQCSVKSMDMPEDRRRRFCAFIMINVYTIFFYSALVFMRLTQDQYVYQRYSSEILGNHSVKTSRSPCLNETGNSSVTEHIQKMSSQELFYYDLLALGGSIPACFILGGLSRFISRRMQLFVPIFGYLVYTVVTLAVIHWHLSLSWMYLGCGVSGMTGNLCAVFLGIFLYTSDITGRDKNRTIAVVVIEGSKGVVGAGLNVVVGLLVEDIGYVIPAFVAAILCLLACSVTLFLPDYKPLLDKKTSTAAGKEESEHICRAFIFPKESLKDPRVKELLIHIFVGMAVVFIAFSGVAKVQTLYLMNHPLCWSSGHIGWFMFGGDMAKSIYTVAIVPLIYPWLPGNALSIVGCFFLGSSFLIFAFANHDFEMYIEAVITLFHGPVIGVNRGEASRLLGPEAQGTLFASIAVMETSSFLLGTSGLYLYNATLTFFKGFVMVCAAALTAVAFFIFVLFQRKWLVYMREMKAIEKTISSSFDEPAPPLRINTTSDDPPIKP